MPNSVVKTKFLEKEQWYFNATVGTCYSSIQYYFKIYLIITVSFYVYFPYRKSRTFWVTDKELPIAGQE